MRGFRITQISRGPKYHLHSVLCKLGQNKRHLDSGMSSASYGEAQMALVMMFQHLEGLLL